MVYKSTIAQHPNPNALLENKYTHADIQVCLWWTRAHRKLWRGRAGGCQLRGSAHCRVRVMTLVQRSGRASVSVLRPAKSLSCPGRRRLPSWDTRDFPRSHLSHADGFLALYRSSWSPDHLQTRKFLTPHNCCKEFWVTVTFQTFDPAEES